MNFWTYLGITRAALETDYLDTDRVQVNHHAEFPLDIYNYTRKTVQENLWDEVTTKCRGIIVNRETGEIVARPFEKFFNYGATSLPNNHLAIPSGEPVVWEKVDGFMCTLYRWDGVDYMASKGSFHSTHAKWATAWLRGKFGAQILTPTGWTPVFEGVHPGLRIVVDYKDRKECVLLALINNDTGEEAVPKQVEGYARALGISAPTQVNRTLAEAREYTMSEGDSGGQEGYVLTWYRKGQPPYRLKMKFIEYLRLHRMVTGVSPKHIWSVLSSGMTIEMNEYLSNSTPWFKKFAEKWQRLLTNKYKFIEAESATRYAVVKETVRVKVGQKPYENMGEERKSWALEIMRPENRAFASVLFAMLDGKDLRPIIWKMVKPMTKNLRAMVDGFAY